MTFYMVSVCVCIKACLTNLNVSKDIFIGSDLGNHEIKYSSHVRFSFMDIPR